MIDLFYAPTPNGWKISIMLEECGLPYTLHKMQLGRGDQHKPDYLKLNPNGRMPAIVDREPPGGGAPVTVFESGAILMYLAEKTGRFMPADMRGRYEVIQWLMWQMGGLGPMLGQNGHFLLYAPEKLPYAIDRYGREARRLYGVLDRRLGESEYLATDYSIADMACFPWIMTHKAQGLSLDDFPNVKRWYALLRARPLLQKGVALGKDASNPQPPSDPEARRILFGVTAPPHTQR
ncbi:MAG TPA: glutathione S-transferase N-terminal domain-containing protein [Xanthobacteraceae bacterium]|nr:glutathione S-transferase N-terminal domain-containing protein [Xanthobacteraceae bacterium]